ncbi:hypothetical protein ACF0H5_000453 [Mactra antiquata]
MDALPNMLQDQSETADTVLNEWSIEDMDDILNILPVDQSENAVMSSSSSRQLGNTPKHGKTHVCQRCNLKFRSYDAYVSHRMTHRSTPPQDNETAGPSGMRSSHVNPNHPRSSATQPSIDDDSQGGYGEIETYSIKRTGTRQFARSAATETTYKIIFNDQWQGKRLVDVRQQLNNLFEDLLVHARQDTNDNDLLRVVIRHHALNHPIVVPLQAAGGVSATTILSKTENVLQSEERLAVDDSFQGYKNVKNKNRQEQKDVAALLCKKAEVPTNRPGFLEAEYEAYLEYPVGIVGPSKVTVKKTQDGWLVYDRRTDTWEPLKTGVQISKKMAIQSGLAQVPSEGYIRRHTFSKASIQWLEYQMEIARRDGESLHIQHALNGGEATILGTHYKVDGLAGNIVYEFHGKCSNLICSC